MDHQALRLEAKTDPEEDKMATKTETSRTKQPVLANHYRPIGPAAISAALLHTAKKKKTVQKIVSPRAA
jgi:hypothetical protein